MTARIIFIHLFNDLSGSPKVLRHTIGVVSQNRIPAKLYVGNPGDGFLSSSEIPTIRYWYRRTGHRVLTLITYLASQAILFIKLVFDRTIDNDAVIYINTLLPFGAALYGKVTGKKVIYHLHEISITPSHLKGLLIGIARRTSSLNLFVSDSHRRLLPIPGPPFQLVHNALDPDFLREAHTSRYNHRHENIFTVLMIASLRKYKGIMEFCDLAAGFVEQPDIVFHLVANDDSPAINRFFADKQLPVNLAIHPRTTVSSSFYRHASLVLNLSRVDQWVETFGLTVLEAMAFGIPVIVPPVGGPTELVSDGVHGYLVDSRDNETLRRRVLELYQNSELCYRMSQACRKRVADFSPESFAQAIMAAIKRVRRAENE